MGTRVRRTVWSATVDARTGLQGIGPPVAWNRKREEQQMSVPAVPDPPPAGTGPIPAEPGTAAKGTTIRPFRVEIPENEVAELRGVSRRPGGRAGRP